MRPAGPAFARTFTPRCLALVLASLALAMGGPPGERAVSAAVPAHAAPPASSSSHRISDVLLHRGIGYLALGASLDAYELAEVGRPRYLGRATQTEELLQLALSPPWIVARGRTEIHLFRIRDGAVPTYAMSLPRPGVASATTEEEPGRPHAFLIDAAGGELLVGGRATLLDEQGEPGAGLALVVQRAALDERGVGPWRETWRRAFRGAEEADAWTLTALRGGHDDGDGAWLGVHVIHRQLAESALVRTPAGEIAHLRPAQRVRDLRVEGSRVAALYEGSGIAEGGAELLGLAVYEAGELRSSLGLPEPASGDPHGTPAAFSGRVADLWYGLRSGRLLRLDATVGPRPRTRGELVLPGRISALAAEGTVGVAVLDEQRALLVSMPDAGRPSWTPLAERGTVWPAAEQRVWLPLAER